MLYGQRVMSGTWGQIWVNGDLWAELSAFQAKFTYNKTEVYQCGEMVIDAKVTSIKGTGSITVNKVYTRNIENFESLVEGHDIRATIVAKLDDPDAFGAERVALYNVSFDDETIMDFAAGKVGSVTHPFTFSGREWLDTVVA